MDDGSVPAVADAGPDAGHDADAGRDAGDTPVQCYLDRDHDGVGGGQPVPCDGAAADAGPHVDLDAAPQESAPDAGGQALTDGGTPPPDVVTLGGDCDDGDPDRAPTLHESCDGIDNDCDADVDENTKNACGGTCAAPFEHELGEACSNGLLGACARAGVYACEGNAALVCNAPQVEAGSEVCGDEVDNDCDGQADEPDAIDATVWYKDCDKDGFAASTSGSVRACIKPQDVGSCTYTFVAPDVAGKVDWDCDDSKVAYRPGAGFGIPPSGATSWDLDCDGHKTPSSTRPNVCSSSFVSHLNENAQYCDASADAGCYVWKDANGRYTTSPPTMCPDPKPFFVSAQYASLPGGHGFWTCTLVQKSAIWPCR